MLGRSNHQPWLYGVDWCLARLSTIWPTMPPSWSWRNSYAAHILWVSVSFVECNCITRVTLLAILIHGTNLKYHPLCQDKCPLSIWKFLNAHIHSVGDSSGWLAWCLLQARTAQKNKTCHERLVVIAALQVSYSTNVLKGKVCWYYLTSYSCLNESHSFSFGHFS